MLTVLIAAALSSATPALKPNFSGSYTGNTGRFSYVGYAATTTGTAPVPLVLVLHGCLETPAQFEDGSRWFEDAQANGYVVVMPEHDSDESDPNGCFKYWNNHDRGKGEPATLVGLVASVEQKFPIERDRVYVAGFSGGGAMAVALAADYPDVFTAIGAESGIEYQPCADNDVMHCFYALGYQDQAQDPVASGRAAYAQDRFTKPIPGIFFQGDGDAIVSPWNLDYLVRSYAVMNDGFTSNGVFPGALNATPSGHTAGRVPGGHSYDTYVADGGLLQWTIVHGMGHAWSGGVNERSSNANDGKNYNDPQGPDATAAMRAFFFAHTSLDAPVEHETRERSAPASQ